MRHIGATSHHWRMLIRALERYDFEILLVMMNLVETEPLAELLPLCAQRGVGVTVMKPVATGLLPSRVALRWLLNQKVGRQDAVHVAAPGATTLEELEDNALAGYGDLALTPEQEAQAPLLRAEWEHARCRCCDACNEVCAQKIGPGYTLGTDVMYDHYRTMGGTPFRAFPWSRQAVEGDLPHRRKLIAAIESCDHCGRARLSAAMACTSWRCCPRRCRRCATWSPRTRRSWGKRETKGWSPPWSTNRAAPLRRTTSRSSTSRASAAGRCSMALLIALVLGTRLWDLGSRVYCHDESIHAWESWKLANGLGYVHDPAYHGPFLYHSTALVFALFGDTDATGRLADAVGGILIALSPWMFRRWLGRWGALAAMLLMALSPVLLTRSRYIRHDHFAIVANLSSVGPSCATWRSAARATCTWSPRRWLGLHDQRDHLYHLRALWRLPGGVRPLAVADDMGRGGTGRRGDAETVPMFSRPRVAASLRALAALPVFDLIVVIGTLMLAHGVPRAGRAHRAQPRRHLERRGSSFPRWCGWGWPSWPRPSAWRGTAAAGSSARGCFTSFSCPLFTSMFTNLQGFATGMVGQLGYWLSQQGVRRGSQPWFYYFLLLGMYEFAAVAIGLGTMVYAAARAVAASGAAPSPILPCSASFPCATRLPHHRREHGTAGPAS